ncbi:hypothetical protein BDA96_03G420300 [Sorghum bicolor]|uniref:Uncharacterized protein n=1 Tax=Sorghum bicolor TaxID=4558 RepID=A0A921UQK3_SORBI|nr:hypothetical protein BDA96_03G420300 [Sorghum bicolor]
MLLQHLFGVVVVLCPWCFSSSIQCFNLHCCISCCMLLQQLVDVVVILCLWCFGCSI